MKKKFATIILLLISGIGLFGFFGNHIATPFGLKVAIWSALVLSILGIIYLIISFFNPDSSWRERLREQGKSPFWAMLAGSVALPALLLMFFYFGLPSVLTFVTGSQGYVDVTADRKISSHGSDDCEWGVYIREYKSFLNDQVCGLQELDWSKLVEGQKIRLFGKKSPFGISYSEYQLLAKQP